MNQAPELTDLPDPLSAEDWDALCRAGDLNDRTLGIASEATLSARAAVRRAATTERLRTRNVRRHRRGWAVGAALGLVAATFVIGVRINGHDVTAPPASAAAVLNRAAEVTLATSDPVVRPGQYLKITLVQDSWNAVQKTRLVDGMHQVVTGSVRLGRDGRPAAYQTRWTRSMWIPSDPYRPWTERNRYRVLRQVSTDRRYRPTYEADSTERMPSLALRDNPRGYLITYDPAWYASLPEDPAQLMATIRSTIGGEGHGVEYDFSEIYSEVLRSGLAPARVRAAVFAELARTPGLVVDERVRTPQGRPGIAIGFGGRHSQRMIFDSATGQYTGDQYTDADFPDVPGLDAAHTTLLSRVVTEVVDRAPDVADQGRSGRAGR